MYKVVTQIRRHLCKDIWLGVVDKIATFPRFFEVLKNIYKQMDNQIPEKTKESALAVS